MNEYEMCVVICTWLHAHKLLLRMFGLQPRSFSRYMFQHVQYNVQVYRIYIDKDRWMFTK